VAGRHSDQADRQRPEKVSASAPRSERRGALACSMCYNSWPNARCKGPIRDVFARPCGHTVDCNAGQHVPRLVGPCRSRTWRECEYYRQDNRRSENSFKLWPGSPRTWNVTHSLKHFEWPLILCVRDLLRLAVLTSPIGKNQSSTDRPRRPSAHAEKRLNNDAGRYSSAT